jgi:hypothetical protein
VLGPDHPNTLGTRMSRAHWRGERVVQPNYSDD